MTGILRVGMSFNRMLAVSVFAVLGIMPFSLLVGFATSGVLDRYSEEIPMGSEVRTQSTLPAASLDQSWQGSGTWRGSVYWDRPTNSDRYQRFQALV